MFYKRRTVRRLFRRDVGGAGFRRNAGRSGFNNLLNVKALKRRTVVSQRT